MFRPMKPETIARRERERQAERIEQRIAFLNNVAQARREYPQFDYPETMPDCNVLYLDGAASSAGPKGFRDAISINHSRIKFDVGF